MKKPITIGNIRTVMYRSAKILGDLKAIKTNTLAQRVSNRFLGKFSGRIIPNVTGRIMNLFK